MVTPKGGKRTCIVFDKDHQWIFPAIEVKQQELEKQGIRISRDRLMVKALAKVFEPYRAVTPAKKPAKLRETSSRHEITFDSEFAWLRKAINKIVRTKKELGIDPHTCFSRELLRLASNGYKQAAKGTHLDRAILDDDT